jgi:hypothetical protein
MFDSLQFKVPETGRKNMKFQPASPRFHDMNRTIVDSVDEYIAELESDFFLSHMQQYFGMVKCVDDNIVSLTVSLDLKTDIQLSYPFFMHHNMPGKIDSKVEESWSRR